MSFRLVEADVSVREGERGTDAAAAEKEAVHLGSAGIEDTAVIVTVRDALLDDAEVAAEEPRLLPQVEADGHEPAEEPCDPSHPNSMTRNLDGHEHDTQPLSGPTALSGRELDGEKLGKNRIS